MPSEKQSFVRWLEACGFPDHKVAELASKRLDIARLQPLWQYMQQFTCTVPDRAQLDSMIGSVDRMRIDQADPASLKHQAQLDKLNVSVEQARQNLLKQQSSLHEQAAQALCSSGEQALEANQTHERYIQVLTLEAYAKRSEKLLQLLAELQRRLNIRLNTAAHRCSLPTSSSVTQGDQTEQLCASTSSSIAAQLQDVVFKQQSTSSGLPSLQHTPETKAAVSQVIQQPAPLLLKASADNIAKAAEDVQVKTADLDLQAEAKAVQQKCTSELKSIEELLRVKQEAHVKQFLQTEAALQAGHAAESQLHTLAGNASKQAGLQQQLHNARAEVAGAKAVISVLESQLANLQHEAQDGANAKAELLLKWDQITSFQQRNQAMDDVIKTLHKENMLNKHRWDTARADTKHYLSSDLLPAVDQVSSATAAMHDCMAEEQAAFDQIELSQLPLQSASGYARPPLHVPTQHRWQRALQVCAAQWNKRPPEIADGLSHILHQAAKMQPALLVQSPDALLQDVTEQAKQQQQGAALVNQWKRTLETTTSAAVAFAKQGSELQQHVAQMHDKEKTDSVPSLQSSVVTCQVAAAFAKKEAEDAIQEWWTQPAVHAVPWVEYEGRNAAEWLIITQASLAANNSSLS